MQSAAYAGLRACGPLGAAGAYIGFMLPALVLILVLTAVYEWTRDARTVVSLFSGLNLVVVALVANATLNFGRNTLRNWRDCIPATGAAVALLFHVSPALVILAAACLGLLLHRRAKADDAGALASLSPSKGEDQGEGMEQRAGRRMLVVAAIIVLVAAVGLAMLFVFNRRLFDIALVMVKVDALGFGGGFASVPLMLHEVVHVRGWMDERTFMDGIALGQVTPGPIAITAAFVGYQLAGLAGALVSTAGIFTTSFVMVLATVPWFDRLRRSSVFRRALRGVLASFVGLLLAVTIQFSLVASWSVVGVLLAAGAFTALRLKVDILWVVLIGAGISVFLL
jgi:chromate transporter